MITLVHTEAKKPVKVTEEQADFYLANGWVEKPKRVPKTSKRGKGEAAPQEVENESGSGTNK